MYGDAAVAGISIATRIVSFLFCVALGIGQGFQPVSAFNYGAKIYSRVKKGFYFTLQKWYSSNGNSSGNWPLPSQDSLWHSLEMILM